MLGKSIMELLFYVRLKDYVKSLCGVTEYFNVGVDVHQGLALRLYLFSVVIDEITKEIQGEIPWCMIFADDIVLVGENHEVFNNKLDEWRLALIL
jgi:hypothetical protein